jgi:hypothetical protein
MGNCKKHSKDTGGLQGKQIKVMESEMELKLIHALCGIEWLKIGAGGRRKTKRASNPNMQGPSPTTGRNLRRLKTGPAQLPNPSARAHPQRKTVSIDPIAHIPFNCTPEIGR